MERVRYRGNTLEYLTLYPDAYDAKQSYPLIVCLHGFGANKDDLTELAPALDPTGYLYVFPNGPQAAFGGPDGTMRAWYERGGNESAEAVQLALAAFDGFVKEVLLRYRIPVGLALLLGFSQGGAMALRHGLPRPEQFAGIAVLSGSLRQVEALQPSLPLTRNQPIFVGHGTADSLVPVDWSHRLITFLEEKRYRPFFQTYPIDHQISPTELRDLRAWLQETLPARKSQQLSDNNP